MNELITSREISCPHCGETIEIVLDLSVSEQQYIEDCFVCCRPILIAYRSESGDLVELDARQENS